MGVERTPSTTSAPVAALARMVNLSDGFQLCIIVGDRSDVRSVVEQLIGEVRVASTRGVLVRWTDSVRQLLDWRDEPNGAKVIAIFDGVGHNIEDSYRKLNVVRDTLRERAFTLLIILSEHEESLFAAEAPDLRSVYSEYIRIPAPDWPDQEAFAAWIGRCREGFEQRVTEAEGAAETYSGGIFSFAYELDRVSTRLSMKLLRGSMATFVGLTGWSPWWVNLDFHPPYVVDNHELECWMWDEKHPHPADCGFWRASPNGRFYLLQGYNEDSNQEHVEPQSIFSSSLPIRKLGEALYHAAQAVERFSDGKASVHFVARWEGLRGRKWTSWPSLSDARDRSRPPTQATAVNASIVVLGDRILQDLPQTVAELLRPLTDAFLVELSLPVIEAELAKLRGRR